MNHEEHVRDRPDDRAATCQGVWDPHVGKVLMPERWDDEKVSESCHNDGTFSFVLRLVRKLIHQGKEHDMSEKKTKHDNYNDAYERRRIPLGLHAAGEDGEDSDIAQIFIDRHETIKIMDNNSIRKLLDTICRVYIYCRDEETGKQFLQDAQKQGLAFSDGSDPTDHHPSDLFRLYDNGTISYTGTAGHMLFRSAEEVIRIDYRKYIDGECDYLNNSRPASDQIK